MEESAIDLLMNATGEAIAPMTIEAWGVLALMVALVAWGLWAERQSSRDQD